MKLHYLHANSHLFPRIPLQAFLRYANGACRDLCSASPLPAYGTWTDANQSNASYYSDDPFVEQPCSTSPWTAYGPRTDATQNTASYHQDDPLVVQQCPCANSSAEAYQTHAPPCLKVPCHHTIQRTLPRTTFRVRSPTQRDNLWRTAVKLMSILPTPLTVCLAVKPTVLNILSLSPVYRRLPAVRHLEYQESRAWQTSLPPCTAVHCPQARICYRGSQSALL